jgi:hypothetical protein
MTNHIEVMTQAVHTLRARGEQYGSVEISFDKISKIASIVLNKPVSPYDVAAILHCMKLSRISTDPTNPDHYVDGINYMAFMAQFAGLPNAPEGNIEDEIATMARRFAPPRPDESNIGGSE